MRFVGGTMIQLVSALRCGPKPMDLKMVNWAVAAVHGLAPRDEAETLLATQMVATYSAGMQALGRMDTAPSVREREFNLNAASKLMRVYSMQMAALRSYRSGGLQKMTVEHVHVHAGGQAIVGSVQSGAEPGGSGKPEDRRMCMPMITPG